MLFCHCILWLSFSLLLLFSYWMDGNICSDILDKIECKLSELIFHQPFHQNRVTVKRKICYHLLSHQENIVSGKPWCRLITSCIPVEPPRLVLLPNLRFLSGHDYFQRHLHQIENVNCPICPLCFSKEIIVLDIWEAVPIGSSMTCLTIFSQTVLVARSRRWLNRHTLWCMGRKYYHHINRCYHYPLITEFLLI